MASKSKSKRSGGGAMGMFGKALILAATTAGAILLGHAVVAMLGVKSWWGRALAATAPALVLAAAASFSTTTRPAVKYLVPAGVLAGVVEGAAPKLAEWGNSLASRFVGRNLSTMAYNPDTGSFSTDVPNPDYGSVGYTPPAQMAPPPASPPPQQQQAPIQYVTVEAPEQQPWYLDLAKTAFQVGGNIASSYLTKGSLGPKNLVPALRRV